MKKNYLSRVLHSVKYGFAEEIYPRQTIMQLWPYELMKILDPGGRSLTKSELEYKMAKNMFSKVILVKHLTNMRQYLRNIHTFHRPITLWE